MQDREKFGTYRLLVSNSAIAMTDPVGKFTLIQTDVSLWVMKISTRTAGARLLRKLRGEQQLLRGSEYDDGAWMVVLTKGERQPVELWSAGIDGEDRPLFLPYSERSAAVSIAQAVGMKLQTAIESGEQAHDVDGLDCLIYRDLVFSDGYRLAKWSYLFVQTIIHNMAFPLANGETIENIIFRPNVVVLTGLKNDWKRYPRLLEYKVSGA